MKSADPLTVGVLRFLLSGIGNKEIEKRTKSGSDVLTDEEVLQVLMTESKKRKEAITIFEKGNRADLADKEKEELAVIQKYLPAQMGKEEVEKIVDKVLATLRQAQGEISFGNFMKEVMKELRGKADAGMITALIKEKLGQ